MLSRPARLRGKGAEGGHLGRDKHEDEQRGPAFLRALQGVETDVRAIEIQSDPL